MIAVVYALLFVLAAGLTGYPLYVIQPFKHQDPGPLAAALWVMEWRGYAELAIVAAAVVLLVRRPKSWRILGTVLVLGAAALSRVNIYERMFHPNEQPEFQQAAESKLDADEKVLAVMVGGLARAYPIRSISYHHVINDTLGGVAVVATY